MPSGLASYGWHGHFQCLTLKFKKAKAVRRSLDVGGLIFMYYVYLLKSLHYFDKTYVGYTQDLQQRLSTHNSGSSPHTSKYRPWELMVSISFKDQTKAIEFEKYLKSYSGRALIKKRFL